MLDPHGLLLFVPSEDLLFLSSLFSALGGRPVSTVLTSAFLRRFLLGGRLWAKKVGSGRRKGLMYTRFAYWYPPTRFLPEKPAPTDFFLMELPLFLELFLTSRPIREGNRNALLSRAFNSCRCDAFPSSSPRFKFKTVRESF